MGLLVGGIVGSGADLEFSPTELGRQGTVEADFVVRSIGLDSDIPTSFADGETDIWIETDAGETYIRVDGDASGNVEAQTDWVDDMDVGQGTPGTDEDVMTLGTRCDSINIYTVRADAGSNVTHSQQWGSFTDDDKSTFFSPVNGTQYGYRYRGTASDPGSDAGTVYHFLQITVRKAGYTDMTFNYVGKLDVTTT